MAMKETERKRAEIKMLLNTNRSAGNDGMHNSGLSEAEKKDGEVRLLFPDCLDFI